MHQSPPGVTILIAQRPCEFAVECGPPTRYRPEQLALLGERELVQAIVIGAAPVGAEVEMAPCIARQNLQATLLGLQTLADQRRGQRMLLPEFPQCAIDGGMLRAVPDHGGPDQKAQRHRQLRQQQRASRQPNHARPDLLQATGGILGIRSHRRRGRWLDRGSTAREHDLKASCR